ncbi:uncharacterized protein LOC112351712 isoform X1 [Selaginella moellendorffii]|uniref:uncharacterized protein LOC112351712 isoform X1 n=1 Tax=Selaginella moellendorffii TaxID=88036 RepID=UPI000D1CAB23|nr:uncharacterized protein LOC112351712 isoform X1 [Selaginella moellendorffii]|eukprot:XP_024545845.1 uncharacterized protein LOC112351712 isoform X1 [Selaginella moellendorffii]
MENDTAIQVGGSDGNTEEHQNLMRRAQRLVSLSVQVKYVALVLSALEKGATYIGQIAFVGATVVLLGGYVSQLKPYDFKLISGLLLSEGVRVFLVSKNVDYSVAAGFHNSTFGGIFTWAACCTFVGSDICCLRTELTKYIKDLFIHLIFHGLQVGSAAVTFGFSLARFTSGDYKPISSSDAGQVANFVYGIRLFYILTLVESSVFLAVKLLGWDFLLLWLSCIRGEAEGLAVNVGPRVHEAFVREGFEHQKWDEEHQERISHHEELLELLCWYIPHEARTFGSIKCMIQLIVLGSSYHEKPRHTANKILAKVVLTEGELHNFLLAVREFGIIPLAVVDDDVIKFLDRIVTEAPVGFLPREAVSKQASEYLIRSIIDGSDDEIKAEAAWTFLKWWRNPRVYRSYAFDPADIFHRIFIERGQVSLHRGELESVAGYESVAGPIRTVFINLVEPERSDVMNNFLSRVDFSKLKDKRSTIDLSGIVPEVIGAESELDDTVVGLVAAWIWFMDESTFQRVISNLTEEALGMLEKNTRIYEAILSSNKGKWF